MKISIHVASMMLLCTLCLTNKAQSQSSSPDYDYLEISLSYEHAFGAKKSVRLVQFRTDSCFYEFEPSIKPGEDFWRRDELMKKGTISCNYFDSVKTEFNKIRNEDILLHNKNLLINDGFLLKMTLSNGSSSVTYQLHTPRKKDAHIEDYKNSASIMLTLVGTTWNEWIK